MKIVRSEECFLLSHKHNNEESLLIIDFFPCESTPYKIGVTIGYVPKDNSLYLKLLNTSLEYDDFSEGMKEQIEKLPSEDFYLDMNYVINWFFQNKESNWVKSGIYPIA